VRASLAFPARGRARAALCALLWCVAAAGCGGSGGGGARGPDLSTPEVVFVQATEALARGDLAALSRVLSPAGDAQVRRDLEAWRLVLRDPATGPRTLARLPVENEAERAALARALDGDAAELLRLYVRADPRTPERPVPVARAPDAAWAQIDYVARDGSRRRVVMTRAGGEWRVDVLQL
jgi:hypothetical protein